MGTKEIYLRLHSLNDGKPASEPLNERLRRRDVEEIEEHRIDPEIARSAVDREVVAAAVNES